MHHISTLQKNLSEINIEMNVNEKFKIGASMNGRIEDRRHPGVHKK